jgi:hypothetical protein
MFSLHFPSTHRFKKKKKTKENWVDRKGKKTNKRKKIMWT